MRRTIDAVQRSNDAAMCQSQRPLPLRQGGDRRRDGGSRTDFRRRRPDYREKRPQASATSSPTDSQAACSPPAHGLPGGRNSRATLEGSRPGMPVDPELHMMHTRIGAA